MTDMIIGQHTISLPFKGARTYIQGPDLVNAALAPFENPNVLQAKFSVHGFISHPNCLMTITDVEPEKSNRPFLGQVTVESAKYWVEIVEDNDNKTPETRVDFDERRVTDHCTIAGETITLFCPPPFSLIETIVSMKKHLMETLISPGDMKWIFTVVDYKKTTCEIDRLSIEIKHNFQCKLTKSNIVANGETIGTLYFSLVKP